MITYEMEIFCGVLVVIILTSLCLGYAAGYSVAEKKFTNIIDGMSVWMKEDIRLRTEQKNPPPASVPGRGRR